uniref:Urotensin-2A n=2 Tax=Catostomidae TaxID=7968 RepID=UTS2A_CATCO|nr:RecName: Full=Urotensin-2A; AltName: Full=Urotensin IIA; Short=U-IIA; Short=UIIA [Catostomus commersonii]
GSGADCFWKYCV